MKQKGLKRSPEKMQQKIARRESRPASALSFQGGLHPLLQLQRTIGNRAVAGLLQAKLAVSHPGDPYEREAERVAEQVTSMSVPEATATAQRQMIPDEAKDTPPPQTKPVAAFITPLAQQQARPEDEQKAEQLGQMHSTLQRATGEESMDVGPSIEQQLGQSSGQGSPLPESVRSYMEPRFGTDFSGVRVHTGSESQHLNRSLNAQAFTVGQDIYYGASKSPTDLSLTAHELTHVVQQDGEQLQRARTQAQEGAATGRAPSGQEKRPVNFLSTFLSVQRAPDPPGVEVPVADRLREAEATVKAGGIDEGAWTKYRESGGTAKAIAERIWLDELAIPDVDPATLSGRDKVTARRLETALVARVEQSLVRHFRALTTEVGTTAGATRVRDQVDRVAGTPPGWISRDIVGVVWREWVGPGAIRDLGSSSDAARTFWTALDRSIATALTGDRTRAGVRTGAFSAVALGRLNPIETIAVGAALERHATWVNGEAGLDGLTDEVFQNVNQPVVRTSDRWRALRAAMRQLQIVAETQLINDTIPQPAGSKVWPERWAELRGRYVATIRKPIWRYWRENIVDASFFGNRISKREPGEGLAREVAQSVRLVEASALRLGGFASMAELHAAQGTKATTGGITRPIAPGTEFRFEPVSHPDWMRNAGHLSFHGTGRALDFRASANPAIKGEAHQLISILGGGELSENTVDRGKLAAWATELAPLMDRRKVLEEAKAGATDPLEQSRLQAEIDRYTSGLEQAVQVRQEPTELRNRAQETYDKIVAIEAAFQAAWSAITASSPTNDQLAVVLLERVVAAQTAAEAALASIATDRAHASEARVLMARLDRIAKVRTMLESTTRAGIASRDRMLATVGSAATGGLTDLPLWMVQAFAEQGWSWGGTWIGFSDAMHFDYMGPVADVITQ